MLQVVSDSRIATVFHHGTRPITEEQQVAFVNTQMLRRAEQMIESCEQCNADAEIPFDWILDRETGNLGSETDYILETPAKCPNCRRDILEKTLVEPV